MNKHQELACPALGFHSLTEARRRALVYALREELTVTLDRMRLPARIDAWADEARRLTATELREYTPARRRTMLACLIQRTQATRLDDMVTMLTRFIGRIEAKARAELEAWHLERRVNMVEMVGVLHNIARLRRDRPDMHRISLLRSMRSFSKPVG